MKLISIIACSAAAVGIYSNGISNASATAVNCDSGRGEDVTVVDGHTACRAAVSDAGYARAGAYDGVGYARASSGAMAFGFGASGGVGASDGAAGVPIAIGLGPDAFAYTSLRAAPAGDLIALTIAMNGSQAQVISGGPTVVCLGSAALAWDSHSGAACLATPFGRWQTASQPGRPAPQERSAAPARPDDFRIG
ncbi:DUF6764 family protein [Nocardia albiluteola]|uniref:DUF6764 family protein n=1 Tax=Nocardia albiluteola TaxID=2842303 RepID=UPI001FDA1CC0|nr:DUF6764 family protein [Nocardia albiluteola]